MPDQLTDRARKAAEEIYAWPRHWPQERDYRIITDEERLSAYAAIIERHIDDLIIERDARIYDLEKVMRDGNELHERISRLEIGGNRQ